MHFAFLKICACAYAGGKGGPQFMNVEDVLKRAKKADTGGAADADFADGLDDHDEL